MLLHCAAGLAETDARTTYRAEMRRLKRAERAFWASYQERFIEAADIWAIPFKNDKRSRYPAVDGDYSGFRRLYGAYEAIEKERGQALVAFARAGDPHSAATVLNEVAATAKQVDRLERDLRKKPVRVFSDVFDQRPGVRRHGLAARERALVKALAALPSAEVPLEAALGTALAKASLRARIYILDALGERQNNAGMPLLEAALGSRASAERIAALEGLARFGAAARRSLGPLLALADEGGPLCRALLAVIDPADSGWIAPLLKT